MQTCYQVLTDSQWEIIKEIVSDQRKLKYNLRDILDALFYVLRTGSQWRNIPDNSPPWESVYYYFQKWKKDGTIESINSDFNIFERKRQGKKRHSQYNIVCGTPPVCSQSVKVSSFISDDKGIDGNKLVNGLGGGADVKDISLLIHLD